jgi:S-DNA-T family DNA segregation ATPase FtsK/SpoIIIE
MFEADLANHVMVEEAPKMGAKETPKLPALAISGEDDPLFAKAVAHVRKSERASISSVQRALLIGYNRAARMIELMEDTGMITPMTSNGSREVIQ